MNAPAHERPGCDFFSWQVYSEDRERYAEPAARRLHSTHATREAALEQARRLIDRSLEELKGSARHGAPLFELWSLFGEDAYVVPDDPAAPFSGQDYARERAKTLSR